MNPLCELCELDRSKELLTVVHDQSDLVAGLYRPSTDAAISNASFAEQENKGLAPLKSGAVHMHPLTLLWLVRLVLAKAAQSKARAFGHR